MILRERWIPAWSSWVHPGRFKVGLSAFPRDYEPPLVTFRGLTVLRQHSENVNKLTEGGKLWPQGLSNGSTMPRGLASLNRITVEAMCSRTSLPFRWTAFVR